MSASILHTDHNQNQSGPLREKKLPPGKVLRPRKEKSLALNEAAHIQLPTHHDPRSIGIERATWTGRPTPPCRLAAPPVNVSKYLSS